MKPTLAHARLLELVSYDPDTGVFTNRISRAKRALAGAVCGAPNKLGYIDIRIEGLRVLAHRLAWFYVYGEWPRHEIDHIDGDPTNNRIANLRDVPHAHNQQNVKLRGSATTGLPGAYRVGSRFKAMISVGGKTRHIGYFDTAEAAHAAYVAAKRAAHPGFVDRMAV